MYKVKVTYKNGYYPSPLSSFLCGFSPICIPSLILSGLVYQMCFSQQRSADIINRIFANFPRAMIHRETKKYPYFCFLFSSRSESSKDTFLNPLVNPKNTGAWKGRLKRFFVGPFAVGLAKNGTNVI